MASPEPPPLQDARESPAGGRAALADPPPDALATALTAFRRHIEAERGLSRHTVRAYLGDVSSLLEHAAGAGVTAPDGVDIGVLRGWLAQQHGAGNSRATLARRAAAARTFTAFAHARGLTAADPGPLLGSPRTPRRLPEVLSQEQVAAVLDTRGGRAPEAGRALALRDAAIMELLYATGIRVGELCGLDLGDLDEERRTVRVFGKGGRERTVPAGIPAVRAVSAWILQGRPVIAGPGSGFALFLGARGRRLDPRTARRVVHASIAAVPGTPDSGPHGLRHAAATHRLEGGAD